MASFCFCTLHKQHSEVTHEQKEHMYPTLAFYTEEQKAEKGYIKGKVKGFLRNPCESTFSCNHNTQHVVGYKEDLTLSDSWCIGPRERDIKSDR